MVQVIYETIGGTGADYDTVQAWETATRVDLIALDQVRVGLLRVQEALGGSAITINNIPAGVSDATHYRELRGAPAYDPITNTGAKLSGTGSSLLTFDQSYARVTGLGLFSSFSGANGTVLDVRNNGTASRCFCKFTGASSAGTLRVIAGRATAPAATHVNSCIATCTGTATLGWLINPNSGDGTMHVRNCAVFSAAANVGGVNSSLVSATNTASVTAGLDFASATLKNCAASDATADLLDNIAPLECFVDHVGSNFKPLSGGPLFEAGVNLGDIGEDMLGKLWHSGRQHQAKAYNIGAYDGKFGPLPCAKTRVFNAIATTFDSGTYGMTAGETTVVAVSASTTSTVLVQGRSDVSDSWHTLDTLTNTDFGSVTAWPQMRLSCTANGGTVSAWLF